MKEQSKTDDSTSVIGNVDQDIGDSGRLEFLDGGINVVYELNWVSHKGTNKHYSSLIAGKNEGLYYAGTITS